MIEKNSILKTILFLYSMLFLACADKDIRLNEIQVIGSHNSYKIPIEEPLWEYLFLKDSAKAKSLQYGHVSIMEQLNLGLRSIELDVFHDPKGGRFLNPKGIDWVRMQNKKLLRYDSEHKLSEPGLKMFHIQDVDFRSHHLLFRDCLKRMKEWSHENPGHTPVFVLINAKDKVIDTLRTPLPFTATALDSIDIEIRSVFSESELITPDLVRSGFESLEKAVLSKGWPELKAMKGRFLFVLDEKQEKIKRYMEEHPVLKGRMMFVNSPEGNPEAAFRIVNDPVKEFDLIKALVKKGYLVRTRADAGTKESRTNDYRKFEKAKASGAQVISTDYYIPTTLYKSSFKVSFEENKYERINKK